MTVILGFPVGPAETCGCPIIPQIGSDCHGAASPAEEDGASDEARADVQPLKDANGEAPGGPLPESAYFRVDLPIWAA